MYRFQFLLLIALVLFQAATTSADIPSICHAGLGTGIRCSDCYTAAHGVLTPIFHRLNPTEAATSRVFTSTSTDFLHTIPRGATHGTCAISIEFSSFELGVHTAYTTWYWISSALGHLFQTCVQAHGHGGNFVENGLAFTVAATHAGGS